MDVHGQCLLATLTFLCVTGGALIGVKLTGCSLVTFLTTFGVLVCIWLLCRLDTPSTSDKSFLGQGGSLAGVIVQYLSGQEDTLHFPSLSYCSTLIQLPLEGGGGSSLELLSMLRIVLQCMMPVEANEPHPLV